MKKSNTILAKQLSELIGLGEEVLKERRQNKYISIKKAVLFRCMLAAHTHTKALAFLVKKGRVLTAETLTRSILENVINAEFIYCTRGNKNVNRLLSNGDINDARHLIKIGELYLSNKYILHSFSEARANDYIKLGRERLKNIQKFYGLKNLNIRLSVERRCKEVDEFQISRKKPLIPSYEWLYVTQYKFLSSLVHVDPRGLDVIHKSIKNPKITAGSALRGAYVCYLSVLELYAKKIHAKYYSELKRIRTEHIKMSSGRE